LKAYSTKSSRREDTSWRTLSVFWIKTSVEVASEFGITCNLHSKCYSLLCHSIGHHNKVEQLIQMLWDEELHSEVVDEDVLLVDARVDVEALEVVARDA